MTFRRVFSKAYTNYKYRVNHAFSSKNLFFTNVLLSAAISTVGDLLEQTYELHMQDIDKYDSNRTAHMAFSGSIAGALCHNWYIFLDKVLVGRSMKTLCQKILMDQFISSPIIILSFFASVAIFEVNPLQNFNDEVRAKFWTLYKAEWIVWPPAQLINLYFMPLKFRVLYDNTVSLGYDIFTSHVKHARHPKEDSEKDSSENIEDTNGDKS